MKKCSSHIKSGHNISLWVALLPFMVTCSVTFAAMLASGPSLPAQFGDKYQEYSTPAHNINASSGAAPDFHRVIERPKHLYFIKSTEMSGLDKPVKVEISVSSRLEPSTNTWLQLPFVIEVVDIALIDMLEEVLSAGHLDFVVHSLASVEPEVENTKLVYRMRRNERCDSNGFLLSSFRDVYHTCGSEVKNIQLNSESTHPSARSTTKHGNEP